jgi:hypothetical protein
MDSHTLEVLTERIEAAERGLKGARQAIWLGSVVVLLVFGGAVWWYLDPTLGRGGGPKTVEAQHFVVRDAQGAARAALEVSNGGAIQLVFFQEPLPGEAWREHQEDGPFSFGVRSITTGPQLLLNNREGKRIGITPTDLTLDSRGHGIGVVLSSSPSGEAQIGLADSTGNMHMIGAGALGELLSKRAAAPSHPPRRRRGR